MRSDLYRKIFRWGVLPLLVAGLFFSLPAWHKSEVSADPNGNTNISYLPGQYWGWNDVVGWIDFHYTHTVLFNEDKLKGYASSSVGDYWFDCSTTRRGPVCNESNFKILNDGNGNLDGWAWNDTIGWISFCGGKGTNSCPGSVSYQVQVNMSTGVFRGDGDDYAWNDVVGWISFNCANHGGCGTVDYKVVASQITPISGSLESAIYDTGSINGAQINSLMWKGSATSSGNVYFQIGTKQSLQGPWTYIGPDGTSNTMYGPITVGVPYPVSYTLHNNQRYFRYKIILYSDIARSESPQVDDVIVNWSP